MPPGIGQPHRRDSTESTLPITYTTTPLAIAAIPRKASRWLRPVHTVVLLDFLQVLGIRGALNLIEVVHEMRERPGREDLARETEGRDERLFLEITSDLVVHQHCVA